MDLETNKVFKTITFPAEVARKTTYLNDVRFDLRRGKGGLAFITDSSLKGDNGICWIVNFGVSSGKEGCGARHDDEPSDNVGK